jgi:xanthine dehydrogenase YagR molybdenum-binding subunit
VHTTDSVVKPSTESETSAQDLQPWTETAVIGKPLPRIDVYERVSGTAVFALDVATPGMLYAAVLRCPLAHTMVKKVDTHTAHAMPGVRAVMSGADPEANVTLPYPWWIEGGPAIRLFNPHCRNAGEEVAVVAAG